MTDLPVTVDDILRVRPLVERFASVTPVVRAGELAVAGRGAVLLKLDSLQPTGSFKLRGAAARIGSIDDRHLRRGVITASTGNHGRAVAYVARELGIPATVCLSENVPPGKVAALERLDCTVDIAGPSQDAASERAAKVAKAAGGPTFVSIFDVDVIAGHGTCGLEIVEQVPEVATVVVPVSAGGLISGIAVAIKAHRPDVRVIGVSMDRGAAMHASVHAGHPVQLDEVETLADSLQGGIGRHNDTSFPIVRALVDDLLLVTEDEIARAMYSALADHRLVLEGAGAVGIAAVASGKVTPTSDGPTVVVCSGANAELTRVAAIASRRAM